jgi:hypothetical protein
MLRRFNTTTSNIFLTRTALEHVRYLTTSERDNLSRVVSSIQSEAKGQSVDLADMADATRNALKQIQDSTKAATFDDARMKAKIQTLQTALKAYSGRLNNIQNEAKSLQTDAEKVLKMIYGENSSSANTTTTSSSSSSGSKVTEAEVEEDFHVEPPMTAQKLEQMNSMPPGSTFAGDVSSSSNAKPSSSSSSSNTVAEEEIVIETVEEEGQVGQDNLNQIRADETPISEITGILHEKTVDFSDCRDAKSLRQRYKDFLDGKFEKPKESSAPKYQTQQHNAPSNSSSSSSSSSSNNNSYNSNYSQQYQNQTYQQQQEQSQPHPSYQKPTPNTTETGIQADPHPNAVRKQIDTQRFVREVKEEIAKENGVQASQIDIWSGMTKLEDHKRLYEYPNLQANPLEVRQKGDIPRR